MSRSFASLALVACALAAAALAARADGVAELHGLFDREWERDLADSPLQATYLGDRRYDDRLPDISPAAEDARAAADARVLEDLARKGDDGRAMVDHGPHSPPLRRARGSV